MSAMTDCEVLDRWEASRAAYIAVRGSDSDDQDALDRVAVEYGRWCSEALARQLIEAWEIGTR